MSDDDIIKLGASKEVLLDKLDQILGALADKPRSTTLYSHLGYIEALMISVDKHEPNRLSAEAWNAIMGDINHYQDSISPPATHSREEKQAYSNLQEMVQTAFDAATLEARPYQTQHREDEEMNSADVISLPNRGATLDRLQEAVCEVIYAAEWHHPPTRLLSALQKVQRRLQEDIAVNPAITCLSRDNWELLYTEAYNETARTEESQGEGLYQSQLKASIYKDTDMCEQLFQTATKPRIPNAQCDNAQHQEILCDAPLNTLNR